MRSERFAVGCDRLRIGLFEGFSRSFDLPPVAIGCARWAPYMLHSPGRMAAPRLSAFQREARSGPAVPGTRAVPPGSAAPVRFFGRSCRAPAFARTLSADGVCRGGPNATRLRRLPSRPPAHRAQPPLVNGQTPQPGQRTPMQTGPAKPHPAGGRTRPTAQPPIFPSPPRTAHRSKDRFAS
jgi:hypothetical protein